MATVQQDHSGGREPNAHTTPGRNRNTLAILMLVAIMIVLSVAAAFTLARTPGAGMGGSLSEERPAAGPASGAP